MNLRYERKYSNVTIFKILSVDFNKQVLTIEFNGFVASVKGVSITDNGYDFDIDNAKLCMKQRQWHLLKECYLNLFNLEFDRRWYEGLVEIGHTVRKNN